MLLHKLCRGYGAYRDMHKILLAIVFVLFGSMARSETVTIVAFGDSLTQGFGLVPDEGLVPTLERWLVTHGEDVSLINGGVSGDTTRGGVARIDWTLDSGVDAVIIALGSNDILRGIDPATSKQNLRDILSVATGRGVEVLLIGQKAPLNYGYEYKQRFDSMYVELAEMYDVLFLEDFFSGFGSGRNDPARLAPLLQADGLHPNAAGVAKIVDGIGPSVLELIERVRERQR